MKKQIEIKNKIVNNLTLKGKKIKSEKILIKSFKELQKISNKQTKELLKLSIIFASPIFKLHKITNKKLKKKSRRTKEIPSFIKNKYIRTSLSIKFIIKSTKTITSKKFYKKFKQEIINSAQLNKLSSIQYKNELQKQVLLNKTYLLYYKWN